MAIKKLRNNYSEYVSRQIARLDKANEAWGHSEVEKRHRSMWEATLGVCSQSNDEPKRHPARDNYYYENISMYDKLNSRGWIYQNNFYDVGGAYSDDEEKLLVLEFADKERQQFERLKAKFSGEQAKIATTERKRISEDVRIAVWRRDQGKCSRCESRENLEYDHIIPHSRGGSDTVRNIELLCERCNREKSDRIQ